MENKAIKRRIKFRYFTITARKLDSKGNLIEEGKLDFDGLHKYISKHGLLFNRMKLKNIEYRIEHFEKDKKNNNLWKMMFLRLRTDQVPNKAKDSRAAEIVKLEEDEYIGEDVSLIYDSSLSVAMIQNNRFSLSYNKIQDIFNDLYGDDSYEIVIRPILDLDEVKVKGKFVEKIDISFAMKDDSSIHGTGSLSKILNGFKKMDGMSGIINVGVGRTKKRKKSKENKEIIVPRDLDNNEIINIIQDVENNKEVINHARLKIKNDTDSEPNYIDLFDSELNDYLVFIVEPRTNIGFTYITDNMITKYFSRMGKIRSSIASNGIIK